VYEVEPLEKITVLTRCVSRTVSELQLWGDGVSTISRHLYTIDGAVGASTAVSRRRRCHAGRVPRPVPLVRGRQACAAVSTRRISRRRGRGWSLRRYCAVSGRGRVDGVFMITMPPRRRLHDHQSVSAPRGRASGPRNASNRPKTEKETTHRLVRWRRRASMA
jgi:hypothetical protein